MNQGFKQDLSLALKRMGCGTVYFIIMAIRVLLAITLGLSLPVILGYCVVHWTVQSLTVIGVAMLVGWFLIELSTAKFERQLEEKYSKGKNE